MANGPGDSQVIASDGATSWHLATARRLLSTVEEAAAFAGLKTYKMRRKMADGTTIEAQINNGTKRVVVDVPKAAPPETPQLLADLWVPRGFVAYPAWTDATFGVGLPIVADGDDPQAKTNLSPGLARKRWTAGGPCGEVLLSPDENAGYPRETEIPTPLMFEVKGGPTLLDTQANPDSRAPKTWGAWRLELTPFVHHYSQDSAEVELALLDAVNDARPDGASKFVQGLRGYARVAEIATTIFFTAGTVQDSSSLYPTTYRTAAERTSKEGYASDFAGATFPAFDRTAMFQTVEGRSIGTTATQFVQAWTQTDGNPVTTFSGKCALLDTGYRGGFMVATFTARDRWIEAGNANWQGKDADLPPISWHNFASLNLAWETFPCQWDYANQATLPLLPTGTFTATNGDCWLKYRRNTTSDPALYDLAMGRHIYCRGRSIALAPNGGLVWGACVHTYKDQNDRSIDRLITLVHHPEDQPTDTQTEGFTRYLRVWWCDVPRKRGLRLAPENTICGTDTTDTWAWRGGDQIDLGSMPAPSAGWTSGSASANSLKYNSVWRFSRDGSRAVCLRDYGSQVDYSTYLNGMLFITLTGHVSRAVELVFSIGQASDGAPPALETQTTFHDYTAGATADVKAIGTSVPDSNDVWAYPFQETFASPLAVDYDDQNRLIYAYGADATVGQGVVFYASTTVANGAYRYYSTYANYTYFGTGDATVAHLSDLANRVLVGCELQTGSLNQRPDQALVLDVLSATFAVKLFRPRFSAPSNDGSTTVSLAAGFPCQNFTTNDVCGVMLMREGVVQSTEWYPNPDGAIWYLDYPCGLAGGSTLAFAYLPLAASAQVQGMFAERFGEHVFGYQVSPQPEATFYFSAEPSDTDCGCESKLSDIGSSTSGTAAQLLPRGGKAFSSVSLPDGDWMMFAKVA